MDYPSKKRGRPESLSPEEKAAVVNAVLSGLSPAAVAVTYGTSADTVREVMRQAGYKFESGWVWDDSKEGI